MIDIVGINVGTVDACVRSILRIFPKLYGLRKRRVPGRWRRRRRPGQRERETKHNLKQHTHDATININDDIRRDNIVYECVGGPVPGRQLTRETERGHFHHGPWLMVVPGPVCCQVELSYQIGFASYIGIVQQKKKLNCSNYLLTKTWLLLKQRVLWYSLCPSEDHEKRRQDCPSKKSAFLY